jgi:hypothetical protein
MYEYTRIERWRSFVLAPCEPAHTDASHTGTPVLLKGVSATTMQRRE